MHVVASALSGDAEETHQERFRACLLARSSLLRAAAAAAVVAVSSHCHELALFS